MTSLGDFYAISHSDVYWPISLLIEVSFPGISLADPTKNVEFSVFAFFLLRGNSDNLLPSQSGYQMAR